MYALEEMIMGMQRVLNNRCDPFKFAAALHFVMIEIAFQFVDAILAKATRLGMVEGATDLRASRIVFAHGAAGGCCGWNRFIVLYRHDMGCWRRRRRSFYFDNSLYNKCTYITVAPVAPAAPDPLDRCAHNCSLDLCKRDHICNGDASTSICRRICNSGNFYTALSDDNSHRIVWCNSDDICSVPLFS